MYPGYPGDIVATRPNPAGPASEERLLHVAGSTYLEALAGPVELMGPYENRSPGSCFENQGVLAARDVQPRGVQSPRQALLSWASCELASHPPKLRSGHRARSISGKKSAAWSERAGSKEAALLLVVPGSSSFRLSFF